VEALEANPKVRSVLLTTANDTPPFAGALNRVVPGDRVLASARELAAAIARMRARSIEGILAAFNVHYQLGLAEGKATELERYMEIYDPKTFVSAVKALFEQRAITFDD